VNKRKGKKPVTLLQNNDKKEAQKELSKQAFKNIKIPT